MILIKVFCLILATIHCADLSPQELEEIAEIERNGFQLPVLSNDDDFWQAKILEMEEINKQQERVEVPRKQREKSASSAGHLKKSVLLGQQNCGYGVERILNGPISQRSFDYINGVNDYLKLAEDFDLYYDDFEFKDRDMLYNYFSLLQFESYNTSWVPKTLWTASNDLLSSAHSFKRLSKALPEYPLWRDRPNSQDIKHGNGLGWWDEIRQGGVGNCYAIASLSAVAIHPDYIKDIFLNKEKNAAGIYTVKFYIRGKPHLITIDDEVLWDNNKKDLFFANPNSNNPSIWGPILEKAWSKIQFNYFNSNGGFQFVTLKALLGCPTTYYRIRSLANNTPKQIWNVINIQQNTHNYPFVAQTASIGKLGDQVINKCGLTASHAYPILASFALKDSEGQEAYYLYMLRDPNGPVQLTASTVQWNVNDRRSWTPEFIAQVPYGIDPTDQAFYKDSGVFFIDSLDFNRCLESFAQAVYLNNKGYSNNWYDVDDEDVMWGSKMGPSRNVSFIAPAKKAEADFIWIHVESYIWKMIPENCYKNQTYPQPEQNVQVFIDGKLRSTWSKPELVPRYLTLTTFQEGQNITINVQYNWNWQGVQQSYSVVVYSQHDIAIYGKDGYTNALHYDGQKPSGFKDSWYSVPTKDWTPPDQRPPTNIWQLFSMSGGIFREQFWVYLEANFLLLFIWI